MKIEVFAMERMQSTYENLVEFNLSESGVHPMRVSELFDTQAERDAFLEQEICYTQSNGTVELRAAIASLYAGATIEHVEVTNGGSEANFVVCWRLLEPGDEVVMMVPNYGQTLGLAKGFAGTMHEWALVADEQEGRWRPDLDRLSSLVNARTKLIVICNPNNPTGGRIRASELDAIAAIAARHGCYVLADEIYRGAEVDGVETASMWGRYERTIVTSGLSKAYGLPGLRIGWIVGPPSLVASTWSYHDYTSIAPGALSDRLARVALQPARREQILNRTRSIIRTNLPVITEWLSARSANFSYLMPEAGAIIYARYRLPVNSTELVNRLREEKSVLIVPGDHFGMDGYLRIGIGPETGYLRKGLDRVEELLQAIGAEA
ncbi:MAG: aminotransferase class I/II-fold pyridoxal phosphate-dependent enzyme [Bacteroidales bacterium]